MAQPTEPTTGEGSAAPAAEGGGGDLSETNYMAVWGGLAVLTVLEVVMAEMAVAGGWSRTWTILGLLAMAVWKALLVALYYMHLKFEPRRLWILAVAPLPLAVILVMAVLQEF